MNIQRDPETLMLAWLEDGPAALPVETRRAIVVGMRSVPRRRAGIRWPIAVAAGAAAVVIVIAGTVGLSSFVNQHGIGAPSPSTAPSVDLGIFEPAAGRIVYYDNSSLWAVDPRAPSDRARVQLTSGRGIPLGWSSDGTRLLLMGQGPSEGHLFVLHADGTETQVTERTMAQRGATISPDGSRVVFHGGTGIAEGAGGVCCARYGLYAVDADGGPAVLLLEARGLVQEPTYSPDGTQIAYVEGAGDHSNSVWLMAADGSSAHQIVSNEDDRVAAGHVRGLQWSPAGDRIALGLGGAIYTFATDGSGFTQMAGGDMSCNSAQSCAVNLPRSAASPYWSPDGTQIAYTTGCVEGAGSANREGCNLAIANADGSNVREFGYGMSGPWHPGSPAEPTTEPSPAAEPTTTTSPSEVQEVTDLLNGFLAARLAGAGVQQYLHDPDHREEDIPLLYAASSGAAYERAEFEPVLGIEWPYGFEAFKVRLFAADTTVVEQLIFVSHVDGRLGIEYQRDGFATEIAPTTENGQPVTVPYTFFDGEVTLHLAHPWISLAGTVGLIPEAAGPTTDGAERTGWDRLVLMADPVFTGPGCQRAPDLANAELLAETIRTDPNLETTAPVTVRTGGAEGLMMDAVVLTGARGACENISLIGTAQAGDRMRMYLFDVPEGLSMRTLAIAINTPVSRFDRAAEAAETLAIEFQPLNPSPPPASASTPVPTPTSEPSEFVIGSLKYAELHAPYREGWVQRSNMLSQGNVIGISAWSLDGIYADPCRWETSFVRLGVGSPSWFGVFIETLVQQPGRDASLDDPEFDFGGWAIAAKIELSVPADLDVETCDQGIYNAWTDDSDAEPPSGNSNHEPGQTDIVYAVNIDRSPVIIHAWLRAGATAEDRAELQAMLAEVQLGF